MHAQGVLFPGGVVETSPSGSIEAFRTGARALVSLPWPLALPWDEALPWQVGLVVTTVVMGTAGVWYLRRPVDGKVKAKADGAKHKKAKKVKKQPDAPPINSPERLAASISAASSSAVTSASSSGLSLERLSMRSEEAEDTVADDGEWQVVPDRSPKSKGSSKQRRKQQQQQQQQQQPQSQSQPQSPPPPSPSSSPSSSPSKAVAKAAGARDKGGAAGKGGAAKGASGGAEGAVDEARAAHNGASSSSRMPPHASEDEDLQLAMALSRSLHEGQGRQGALHDAHIDALDEGWSPDGRSGGAHEAPEPIVRLEAPEPPSSPTYAACTRPSVAGAGGSAGGAGAGTGAGAGGGGASVVSGVVLTGNSSPADAMAAARVTVELSLLDESERKQLLDELLRDKALGKRVDRPCDRLREGMTRVDGGQLSKAAFDVALVDLAGPEKVERVMNHVRSPSDARSDASTVRAKNSPTR